LAWTQAGVAGIATLAALLFLHYRGGIAIAGALKALVVAAALVICYGLVVAWTWPVIVAELGLSDGLALAVGLGWATLLSLPTLVAGWKLKVFALRVFSG
jgi:hypothetical protein